MKKGIIALSPIVVFILFYLVTSIIAGDFYKIPITVAFMVSSIYAITVFTGRPLMHRINSYSRGAATEQMMLMIWIFVLAGAFAHSAKQMGSIDATVNLALSLLPPQMIFAGMFLAACFISLSIGTSVGTIAALTPIAVGLAQETGADLAMMTAIIVGGSFFGDNLSFISDTTIMATQTQGCRLSDKFRVNAFIVMPAALVILVVYYFLGQDTIAPQQIPAVEWVKVIPYLTVLVTAVCGMNVMAVLTIGIVLCGIIGMFTGSFDIYGWFGAMGDGIMSMGELIIVTMMAGGMLELIKQQGGIDFIINMLTRRVSSKRGAELSIATLVSLVDVCTANNTVAILTVGDIAKQIGDRYGVDNKKCASILDTFSCTVQGLIPYGAQLLIAAGLASVNPVAILPYLYYPFALGIVAILSILLRYPKRYS
ncbi:sodium:proton antiporter [Xylanibacter ruminicola]|uniref:Sodium transporter, NhaC sodium:hydrogen antiporter (NhaC) family n=2 Tax=Xylanibacter ruminicola TaxID=839 RepID=D5ERH5_XYLR2|nr:MULTISPECIES: Na+/H+ antiporter NhaC family protein [Prevotellaceae]ADE81501.1 sodium transporter, NhaC sodium:hydrogen antiporter (NhaC) family [Xylanibacter ruminicola 23]QVJ81173.1 Na+/H+ antiporter NhaC family protein [Xylanibacter ruminicola]SDQ06449.1 Na+/H+ antiporter NhaC [Prevotella sp. khp1]SEH73829.1 Na+/H+ antiporter NhaC [Xylanibacter ruminicola]GJG33286.1 sodium:proton antiporter [Xylanibacter ruminicola]